MVKRKGIKSGKYQIQIPTQARQKITYTCALSGFKTNGGHAVASQTKACIPPNGKIKNINNKTKQTCAIKSNHFKGRFSPRPACLGI